MVINDYKGYLMDSHEVSIDTNSYNFLCIYQHHINGYVLSIPNWEVCIEMSQLVTEMDIGFNACKLSKVLKIDNAKNIATNIITDLFNYLKTKGYIKND